MPEILDTGAMLRVGTVLRGTYQIESYLASGGFGNTYVAKNIAFDELVAIKEFYISGVTERDNQTSAISVSNTNNQLFFEEQLNKFKKEAKRLRKLKHDNIVGVHDLFDENGTSYYVMDYIEGESLAQYIKRTNMPIGEKDATNYFLQIIDALETVHNMGIWHLDLKPGNIMLDKNGTVKLIDFGASKQQGIQGGSSTSTAVAYTVGYAPREQMEQNLSKFGPWTDIYALGATLYNILTTYGPPLPSDIDDDRTPDKSRALPMPYVSLNMRKLILWMMSPSRFDRPQSVAEVRRFLSGDSGPATVVSPIKNKSKQKNPTPPPAVSSSQPVSSPQPAANLQQPMKQKPLDEPQKKTSQKMIFIILGVGAVILLGLLGIGMFSGGDDGTKIPDNAKTLASTGKTVKDIEYTIGKLGICKYSGEVNEAGQPHGKGEAVFPDGRRYVGSFVNGNCHGDNAVFTYDNGDTFEGSFDNNAFKEGKYTNLKEGEYFIGSFTDGAPDKGKWYDKNGKELN